ncbi:hypothetical protein U875_26365 [Pandoraea pnomenusa 3kgm]|jgi:hypothetical protein|nr:hypothetical protein X636_19620 [Pandoraea pnomenusa]AIM43988.1 hypothetical protein U875_26365 [Pandoraea pnomenusa 3kgm]AMQ96091.1 hypothetical protein DA70_24745 [Pandoraea pnomenusa]
MNSIGSGESGHEAAGGAAVRLPNGATVSPVALVARWMRNFTTGSPSDGIERLAMSLPGVAQGVTRECRICSSFPKMCRFGW